MSVVICGGARRHVVPGFQCDRARRRVLPPFGHFPGCLWKIRAMNVRIDSDGPVTTVVIDRPGARNAVDGPTAAALADAFRTFDADPAAHVAVLTGADGTFCAGADLKAIGTPAGNQVEPDSGADGPMGPTRMRLGKPVIAAIEGYAVAGGLELALWCDLRVAAEDATLGVFCRRWGVPLIDGGTVRLPRLIGEGGPWTWSSPDARSAPPRRRRWGWSTASCRTGTARQAAEALARRARRTPPGLPAQRPALGARAGGPGRGGGPSRRARARHAVAERRRARGRGPVRVRSRPARGLRLSPGRPRRGCRGVRRGRPSRRLEGDRPGRAVAGPHDRPPGRAGAPRVGPQTLDQRTVAVGGARGVAGARDRAAEREHECAPGHRRSGGRLDRAYGQDGPSARLADHLWSSPCRRSPSTEGFLRFNDDMPTRVRDRGGCDDGPMTWFASPDDAGDPAG